VAFSEWQLVKRRSHKAMFLVEDRQATLAGDAIRILSADLIGAECAQPAAVVN